MTTKPKVIVGMSGGIDSSVAASLLVEQGYDVQGVTLKVWEEENPENVSKRWQERSCCKVGIARHVAQLLEIPHTLVDTQSEFKDRVINDFISGYQQGTTPNPCVRCNERVKFATLYRMAIERQADFVATGHYAQITRNERGDYEFWKGVDSRKDQSYFLYRISPMWLPKILFPVGHLEKAEVWKHAEKMGLPTDELKESQEICFVTQGNYRSFLQVEAPESQKPGPFLDTQGNEIGQHEGIAFYTPGQRKGLGLATGVPVYVHTVIPESNAVVVGSKEGLKAKECQVAELNVFQPELLKEGQHIEVKLRYASPPVAGFLSVLNDKEAVVKFETPQLAISPGQSAVFYRGKQVLGGGIIQKSVPPMTDPYPESVSMAFQ